MSVILLTRRCEDTNHKAETAEKRVILTLGDITWYIMKDMSRARLTLGNQVSFQTIRLINCTKQRNKIIEKKERQILQIALVTTETRRSTRAPRSADRVTIEMAQAF